MLESPKDIPLLDLLDEVNRDVVELRKKFPQDYQLKNVTMWWELERERLLLRHGSGSVLRQVSKTRHLKQVLFWMSVGWLTMVVLQVSGTMLLR